MIETPLSTSPPMIARSTRAPPRQRGSSDGWTLSIGWSESSGSRIRPPNADTQTTSGRADAMAARASSSLTLGGCRTSMPSSRAAAAAGGGARRRPRPRGRSGRVTTSKGRCAEAASRRSTATAKSLVPRKTVCTAGALRRAVGGLLPQDADRLLALLPSAALDHQHAVEMVDLVLDDARLEPRGLDDHRLAV